MLAEHDFWGPGFAQAVLDAAPVLVVVLDARGRILHYNPFTERLCGRPVAEVRGLEWFEEFLFDDERDSIRSFFAHSITTGPVDSKINYIRGRGGERRLIEWYDRKVRREDGGIASIVAIGVDITDRVREASERSELAQRFELFANRVDEAFFMTDVARTRVLYLSPAFDRITGVSRERVYADVAVLAALLHPDDRQSFVHSIGSPISAESKQPVEREYRILRPIADGEPELRWVGVHYSEVSLHEGEARRVVGTITDITARRESKEKLRRLTEELEARVAERTRSLELERQRLQQIIDGMAVFVCILDPGGRVLQVNARTREAVTRLPEPIVGRPFDGLPGLRYGEHAIVDIRAALDQARRGLPARLDLELTGPQGQASTTDTTISPILDLEGRVLELVTTSVDVTERRAIERRLRESLAEIELKEARLADAQRIAEVGDWEWDVVTNELRCSDQMFRIFGLPVGSIQHARGGFLATIHEDDQSRVKFAVDHALQTGEHYEVEHRVVRPDGELRSILENGEVTCDALGRPLRMKGTAQDVTRQKQVEAQLRASLGEKEALLHEIHHRVKNNLQVVISLLYLKGVNASAEIREVLDECSSRIRSMALIHAQLYVSGELARIEIRDFLAKLGEELTRVFAGDRMIHIQVTGEGLRLGIERAVPVALLANELLTNALKYAYPNLAPGCVAEIRVRVCPDLLEITDDGIGLPVDFDGSAANSLGLRLVHSLARQLDGRLEFSTLAGGTGTCVRLLLPR